MLASGEVLLLAPPPKKLCVYQTDSPKIDVVKKMGVCLWKRALQKLETMNDAGRQNLNSVQLHTRREQG